MDKKTFRQEIVDMKKQVATRNIALSHIVNH